MKRKQKKRKSEHSPEHAQQCCSTSANESPGTRRGARTSSQSAHCDNDIEPRMKKRRYNEREGQRTWGRHSSYDSNRSGQPYRNQRQHYKSDYHGNNHWPKQQRSDFRHKRQDHHQSSNFQQSSSGSTSGSSLDIPGFYYDPEKKQYFKIRASTDVKEGDKDDFTKEGIARKQAEDQRLKDLAVLNAGTSASSGKGVYRKSQQKSFSSVLLNDYQRGNINKSRFQRMWLTHSVGELRQTGHCKTHTGPAVDECSEHVRRMEMTSGHDGLLCLMSRATYSVQRIKLFHLKEQARTKPRELSLQITPAPSSTVIQCYERITSMCWSDILQYPDRKYVLYTTTPHIGRAQSLAFIRCLQPNISPDHGHLFDINLGTKATWTCSWNYHKQQLGVGVEKGCFLIDVNTRRLWKFKTKDSDALSHIFSKGDGGNTMYAGIRCGNILKFDLRASSTQPISLGAVMKHESSVCCLRLSADENYLYANDFVGMIKQWDLRMQKPVLSYEGFYNRQCKLPFHIDETQSLLYCAGQDCYTKIWCVKTGKLLHSIPPPYESSLYTIPSVLYSTRWAGIPGNAGLIMGGLNNFFQYS